MTEVKRRYDSSRRREQAEQTRRRLRECARELFAERGYVGTTVEAVAAAAGTSPQTFYSAFGSKRAVLFALLDDMAAAADPTATSAAIAATSDPHEQLRALVDFRVRLYTGGLDLLEAARTGASSEPDVAAMWTEGEERRRRSQRDVLADWHRRGVLRGGLSRKRADDVLWALTGPDVYRLMVVERGWAPATLREWLVELLSEQLLAA